MISISSSADVTAAAAKSPPLQGRPQEEGEEEELEEAAAASPLETLQLCSLERSLGRPASSLFAEIDRAARARRAAEREGTDGGGGDCEKEDGEPAEAGGVEGAGGGEEDAAAAADADAAADDEERPSLAAQLFLSFFRGSVGSCSSASASAADSPTRLFDEDAISEAGVAKSARATARAAVAEEKP